jgi:AcrR family transcriptional regulator
MTETAGLRERKKARTRWAIQEHALRLFADRGYAATTIDQIAAAADISPSTFFRYFPTKEDVVVQDEYDAVLVEAFRQAATSADPVRTLREVMSGVFAEVPEAEWVKSAERSALVLREPALRTRSIENLLAVADAGRAAFAEAAGRPADDPQTATLVGACMGVLAAVGLSTAPTGSLKTMAAQLDDALARLEGVDWFGSRS